MNKVIAYIVILCFLVSCSSYRKIVYLQKAGETVNLSDSLPSPASSAKLKVGDLLVITVNASTADVAIPFNLPLVPLPTNVGSMSANPSASANMALQNYLIDTEGNIMFPVIGKINAVGMTKNQLSDYIRTRIYPHYIKENPIINIRYANYKISVLGEVQKPCVYTIENEKVSILEALAMAGDLTIFGKRNNILLIRENEKGARDAVRLDLRDKNLINSPYYYLQQNDVLYVQPNRPKARSAGFSTAESLSISVVGTLISLVSLIVLLKK